MAGVLTLVLTVAVIGLLMLRELISGLDGAAMIRLRQLVNLIVGPLVVVFFIAVVAQLNAMQRNNAAKPTAQAAAAPTTTTAVAEAPTVVAEVPTTMPTVPNLPTATPTFEPFVSDTFDTPSNLWPERKNGGWSAVYSNSTYEITLDGQPNAGISTELAPGDYHLSMDVTVEQGGAGLVFLSSEPANFYRILLSNDGAYTIQTVDQTIGRVASLVDWTESSALQPAKIPTYRLSAERTGNMIQFSVNGQPLTTFAVPAGAFLNRYGFALASRSGNGRARFDNLVGERLPAGIGEENKGA